MSVLLSDNQYNVNLKNMARQSVRSDSRLPTVRQAYSPSYAEENQNGLSPRFKNKSDTNHTFMQSVEGRLAIQEETTQKLLDRAYKVKEDVIDVLSLTQNTWHEERRARQLLQDHIQTITDVVRKLNRDIEVSFLIAFITYINHSNICLHAVF